MLGVSLPTNIHVKSVLYGINKDLRGKSFGNPGSTTWLCSFINYEAQKVEVRISEKYGFIGFYGRYDYPAPKRMDVKISAEAAADKAVLAVPLISGRRIICNAVCGVQGVRRAQGGMLIARELAARPEAGHLVETGVPEERACGWSRSQANTRKDRTRRTAGSAVFRVYIDAATGEVVGANFT